MSAKALIAGMYEMGPVIGSGAAGVVHLGRNVCNGERVAIKAIDGRLLLASPCSPGGFDHEARALRRLNHPNIIRLLATAVVGHDRYLVLEYAGGGSLAELLQRQPQLPVDRALAIGRGVAAALTQVHARGIVHRDIKPSNILLSDDGAPRLTDFGLARLPHSRAANDGTLTGTFLYLSPEAWRSGKLDARADIWSLGIVIFEMLAGRRPFDGDSPHEIRWAIENEALPDVRDYRDGLPAGLGDLVRRMLLRDPAARIASAAEVAAELALIETNRTHSAPGAAHHGQINPPIMRYPVAFGAGRFSLAPIAGGQGC